VLFDAANRFADPNTRNRATLGGNIVNASPGGDSLPPLFALDARVLLAGADGSRSIPVGEFITGSFETALEPGILVTGVSFRPCARGAFIKIGLRRAMAVSVETVAVCLDVGSDGVVTGCRIAFGALGPTPLRGFSAEKVLIGKQPSQAVLEEAAEAALNDIQPRDGLRGTKEYRNKTAGVILRRAIDTSLGCSEHPY